MSMCQHRECYPFARCIEDRTLTPEQERMVAEQDGSVPYYAGSVAADEQTQERWKEAGLFTTKDSGKREEYASGMVRDTEEGKARFDLLLPKGVPYANQMLTRFAELMARGAGKYGDRNWEKARGQEELDRYCSSALRHLQQWVAGEDDEDHAAAVMFNLMAGETVKFKMADCDHPGACSSASGDLAHHKDMC